MSTTLLDLNDDCLEEVFKRVKAVADQVQLAHTCHRFKPIIVNVWENRWKHDGALNLNELNLEPKAFSYFIRTIPNVVQSITARHHLFSASAMEDASIRDLHFWRVIKNCPNLKELKLHRIFRGIDRDTKCPPDMCLPQLQALALETCTLSDDDVEAIFENEHLRLKRLTLVKVRRLVDGMLFSFSGKPFEQLEELKIDLDHACTSLIDIFHLRRLKVLTVCGFGTSDREIPILKNIICRTICAFEDRFTYFETDHNYGLYLLRQLGWMSFLNTLKFYRVPITCLPVRCAENLTDLRELSLVANDHITNSDLLNFVRLCPKLAVLDVRGCSELTENLIWQSGEILLKRNSGIRLKIIISESSLSIDIIRHPDFMRLQSVLEITDTPILDNTISEMKCLTFKFLECSDEEHALFCRHIFESL